jgi:hypothetical protein
VLLARFIKSLSKDFIIFNDRNWPVPWTVVDVKQQKTSTITEQQRAKDNQPGVISVLNPDRAWKDSAARSSN